MASVILLFKFLENLNCNSFHADVVAWRQSVSQESSRSQDPALQLELKSFILIWLYFSFIFRKMNFFIAPLIIFDFGLSKNFEYYRNYEKEILYKLFVQFAIRFTHLFLDKEVIIPTSLFASIKVEAWYSLKAVKGDFIYILSAPLFF